MSTPATLVLTKCSRTSHKRTPLGPEKKCPLKRGVRLWEFKNVVFVCSWGHDQVSAYERCLPTGGVR